MSHPSELRVVAEESSQVLTALDRAEQLEAEGKWREAIDELTRLNRRARDTTIESRLVRLRHDAFDHLDRSSPPPWPPEIAAEPPPGSPPEVAGTDLDAAMLSSAILGAGCILVRNLVPPASVDRLVHGIDRAFAALDLVGSGRPDAEAAPWFERFRPRPGYPQNLGRVWVRAGGGALAVDAPGVLFDLLEVVDQARVPDLVAAHLGERPALSAKKTTLRRVTKDTNAQWHQDGSFMGTDIRTVNLWLALSHCGDDAPGLDIVPRRLDHIVEGGTSGAIFDWSASPQMVDQAAGGTPVCRPVFEPGDALLFDHMFMHRTAAGPEMTRERHAVEMWFFAPSLYPTGEIPLVV